MTMPTLVLIPGLGSDAAVWRRTVAALGGINCIVGDTLHGASLPDMADEILRQAPERFALAGVSMGGMVALEIMKAAPYRVTSLALLDTMAQPDGLGSKLSRHLVNAVVRLSGDFRGLAERSVGSLVHPEAPHDVKAELMEMSLRVGARTYVRQNRAVAARGDLRPALAHIAVPTAVIVGRQDKKRAVWARHRGTAAAGVPIPTTVNLRIEACARLNGVAANLREARGSKLRVEGGRLGEPSPVGRGDR